MNKSVKEPTSSDLHYEIVEEIFKPIKIGNMTLSNRLVMSPMASHFANKEGKVTEQLIKWYEERAKGGVGLIVTESNYVRIDGRGGFDRLGLHEDECIAGHKKLVDVIHQYDTKICAQLHHAGRLAPSEAIGSFPIGPSTTHNYVNGNVPMVGIVNRELSTTEIEDIVVAYGDAARRAKLAGFDAIQIHGAHGYLIHQFLSPLTNLRIDEYGGSIENRCRFLREVIERVKLEVGVDFPILLRLSAEEKTPGGYTLDFIVKVIKIIENLVDEVDISSGTSDSMEWILPPKSVERDCFSNSSKVIKEHVKIPVGVVGRIKTAQNAAKVLAEQKADLINLGRALIADPYLPMKIRNGMTKEIKECIACNRCYDEVAKGGSILCAVNPFAGRESTLKLLPTKTKKSVMVIGGGCAGMQAAITAKQRGHHTVLYEAEKYLGGQAFLAANNPMDPEIGSVVRNLQDQLTRLQIPVYMNTRVNLEMIKQLNPDHIILATGAVPQKKGIQGIDLPHVKTVLEILKGDIPNGNKAVVIGGGLSGACVSEFLHAQNIDVTMIKRSFHIPNKAGFIIQKEHTHSLNSLRIPINVGCDILEIKEKSVIYKQFDQIKKINADIVVIAYGMKPNAKLLEEIKSAQYEVTAIGDCIEPREVLEAIHEGFDAANTIGIE